MSQKTLGDFHQDFNLDLDDYEKIEASDNKMTALVIYSCRIGRYTKLVDQKASFASFFAIKMEK